MRLLKVLLVSAACSQLGGCFIFIPGSVVGKISDTLTGDEGEHCVTRAAKVGDTFRLMDGRTATVKSLSGASMRCNDATPIRAALAIEGLPQIDQAKK